MCIRTLLTLTLLITAVGCSERLMEPVVESLPEMLPADPDGMSLPGDPTDNGWKNVVSLTPSPVSDDQIKDGLLTTRLRAAIAPDATVQQVNDALASANAAIVSMRAGRPMVVLVIDEVADENEAQAKADQLAATDAFLAVFPGRGFRALAPPEPGGVRPSSAVPPNWDPDTENFQTHLHDLRMPQAWNARDLSSSSAIPVFLPDFFVDEEPLEEIPGLNYTDGFGLPSRFDLEPDGTRYEGNRGFYHAGLIGASWEAGPFAGTHPDAAVSGLLRSGLDMSELMSQIALHMGLASGNQVLATCFGFDMSWMHPVEVAMLATDWKFEIRALQNQNVEGRVLHIAAAGDWGGQNYGGLSHDTAPWSVAAHYPSIVEFLEKWNTTPEDTADYEEYAAYVDDTGLGAPVTNLIIVGASDRQGNELPSSSIGTDVRAPGVEVWGTCYQVDPSDIVGGCGGEFAAYDGTAPAAAQVAGLASYLWSMSPGRSRAEIQSILESAYETSHTPGIIDGYRAALAMDPNLVSAFVREEVLDVTGVRDTPDVDGNYDSPNNIFDEKDIKVFVDMFEEGRRVAEAGIVDLRMLRYDLNGDGKVGTPDRAAFDLDANQPPGFGAVNLTTVVNDHFVGNVNLTLDVNNATVGSTIGVTDGNGFFSTNVTLNPGQNEIEVSVFGGFEGGAAAQQEVSARRPNEIRVLSRNVALTSDATFFYMIEQGDALVQPYRDFREVETAISTPYVQTVSSEGEGTFMGASHEASATARLEVDTIETGGMLSRIEVDGTIEASSSLSAAPDVFVYEVFAASSVEVDIEFQIWGDPVSFQVQGNVDEGQFYDVKLYSGPNSNSFRCHSSGDTCEFLEGQGELVAGTYTMGLVSFHFVSIRNNRDDLPPVGVSTFDSVAGFTLTLTQ